MAEFHGSACRGKTRGNPLRKAHRTEALKQASTSQQNGKQKGRQIGGPKMVLHARGITHGTDSKPSQMRMCFERRSIL
jgi:hypothetical protein